MQTLPDRYPKTLPETGPASPFSGEFAIMKLTGTGFIISIYLSAELVGDSSPLSGALRWVPSICRSANLSG